MYRACYLMFKQLLLYQTDERKEIPTPSLMHTEDENVCVHSEEASTSHPRKR